MVRFYRLCKHIDRRYECIGYYLDPSVASRLALALSKKMRVGDYALVSQIDVYPNEHVVPIHQFVRH